MKAISMSTPLTDASSIEWMNRTNLVEKELKSRDEKDIKEACQGVESLFLEMMLKEMKKSVGNGGLFPESLAKDIYTTLFHQKISQEISKSGRGIGISDMLSDYLLKR